LLGVWALAVAVLAGAAGGGTISPAETGGAAGGVGVYRLFSDASTSFITGIIPRNQAVWAGVAVGEAAVRFMPLITVAAEPSNTILPELLIT
jgi:hypothetical protein